jgi:hypothetical protein
VGPSAGLEAVETRKILPRQELNPGLPVCSPSLYQSSYLNFKYRIIVWVIPIYLLMMYELMAHLHLHDSKLYIFSNGLQAGRPGFDSRQYKIFLFSTVSRLTLGTTQPPIQWVPWALSPGVKRQGHEADPSPPSSAEVKKGGTYTSTTPYVFMA